MKRILIVVFILLFASSAFADVLIEKKIDNARLRQDKNGNNYVMFVIKGKQQVNGIEYDRDTLVFAFGDSYQQAKDLKKGDTLKAICAERMYQGQKSYNILKLVP